MEDGQRDGKEVELKVQIKNDVCNQSNLNFPGD